MNSHHRERQSGAAMAEAAILVSLLGVLLLGALFAGRLHLQSARARAEARSCALRYAASGCRHEPAGCEPFLGAAERTPAAPEERLRLGANDQSKTGIALGSLPELQGALDGLFGETTHARVPWRLPMPGAPEETAEETADGTASYSLLCAQQPAPADLALRTLCILAPPLCGD